MLRCYCPECGQRIGGIGSAKHRGQRDKYCVSISGLFKNIDSDVVLLETALSKKLAIDFSKIGTCTSLRVLSEKVEEDSQPDGMSYSDNEEFYSIIDNANKLHFRQIGMDLDDPDEYTARLNQYNYVWIRLLLERLSIQVNRNNRVLDYLFSVVNPDENENMIQWFLNTHSDWEAEPFQLPGADGKNGFFTCYPHRTKGEGQFTALLKKKGNSECPFIPDTSLPKAGSKDAVRFAESFPGLPNATHIFGRTLIHTEFLPDIKGISVYRIGLHLGEIHDSYFIPDHASAYIAASSIQKSIVDPEHALRYMAGETVDGNESGWTVVTCNGMPLGWGKGTGGIIKNHYPKGLRNNLLQP